jgi:putative transposase
MPFAPQEIRTYFITSVTASRRSLFQVEQNAILFIDHLNEQRSKNRIDLHAFVIMPDHVHLLLTPSSDISLEKTMQYIKGGFSFRLKSKMDIWERSYDSRRIQNLDDFNTHVRYTHLTPVRTRLSPEPELYPYSSANPTHSTDPIPYQFT